MHLCYVERTNDLLPLRIIDKLKASNEVILFGAGRTGDYFLKVLARYNIFPKCFCDNYQSKQGTMRNGIPVMDFNEAIEKYPNSIIFITSVYYEEIQAQILERNPHLSDRIHSAVVAMSWEILGEKVISEEYEYIKSNHEKFTALYEQFEDNSSKQTLENLLNYRLTRQLEYLSGIKSEEETYFDTQIVGNYLEGEEWVFVDGGSFIGDSVEAFLKFTKGIYKEIHCYEADRECIEKLNRMIKEKKLDRVKLHKAVLWINKEKQQFQLSGAGGSSISVKTDNTIEVEAEDLDSLFLPQVDFIKLDIEGAEEKALEGMLNTIKRCKPILAISAYHKKDDLLVLSDFIKDTGVDYKIYLRHYLNVPAETVLYAVPRRE